MALYNKIFDEDMTKHIQNIEEAETWLRNILYHPDFTGMFEGVRIKTLITATDLLTTNLRHIQTEYRLKAERS